MPHPTTTLRAVVHAASPRLAECELTFAARTPIDIDRARRQHADYRALLTALGVEVILVDVSPAHADAVFVEDTAVVLDEVAIACAMGAASRRAEVDAMRPVLARHRRVLDLPPEGTLEGGDVLRCGRDLFVGNSRRTNPAGIAALRRLVSPFGYRVHPVDVHGCLHLKTAVTAVGERTLLANPAWIDPSALPDWDVLAVPRDEPNGANALLIGTAVCLPVSQPSTAAMLRARGHTVHVVDIGEFERAEAGMTCLSLLFAAGTTG